MFLRCTHVNDKTAFFAQTFVSQSNHKQSSDESMVAYLDISEVSNHQGRQLLENILTHRDIVD